MDMHKNKDEIRHRKLLLPGVMLGIIVLATIALPTRQSLAAHHDCTHNVIIYAQGNKPERVDQDELHVRTGDKVCWLVTGRPQADFEIVYADGRAPTSDSGKSKGGWVQQVITASHTGDPDDDTYKYSVILDGNELDPSVIIDP